MQKYEYSLLTSKLFQPLTIEDINDCARDGWEVVSVGWEGGLRMSTVLLKREVATNQESLTAKSS